MVRTAGSSWREPSVTAYGNESKLQKILAETPSLIPGVGEAVSAIELPIPGSGSLDLVVVEPDGSITLVECKLASNAEARRSVVGQIASYAAGLWGMPFETFNDAFKARSQLSLMESTAEVVEDPWDGEEFRRAVTNNLATGRFRLVIAVDSITEELKRIVEFLNAHTTVDVEILALEVGYVAEGDTEILLPRTHGLESIRLKGSSPSQKWSVDDVFAKLDELCPTQAVREIARLGEAITQRGGHWRPGSGIYPSMSAFVYIGTGTTSLLTVYTDPGQEEKTPPRISINFGNLRRTLLLDQLGQILKILETSEVLKPSLQKASNNEYHTYPAIPLTSFAEAQGADLLIAATAAYLPSPTD